MCIHYYYLLMINIFLEEFGTDSNKSKCISYSSDKKLKKLHKWKFQKLCKKLLSDYDVSSKMNKLLKNITVP